MVVLYRDEATVFCVFPNLVLVGSLCGMDANFNFKDVLCDCYSGHYIASL